MTKTSRFLFFLTVLLTFFQILLSTSIINNKENDVPLPTEQGITFKYDFENQLKNPTNINKDDPPFEIFITTFKEQLGMEVQLKIKNQYLGELRNIYFGAVFPRCQDYLQMYVDMRDWPLGTYKASNEQNPSNGARYSSYVKIARPQICLKDLGVEIPYTTACLYFDDFAVMPRGVYGSLKADLSFGIPLLQWKFQGLELWKFSLGNVSSCFMQRTEQACLGNTKDRCGWCSDTNGYGLGRCFQARKDGLGDICGFCNRCKFFTSKDRKAECGWKESCGWCEKTQSCHPGDKLGPFDYGVGSCDIEEEIPAQLKNSLKAIAKANPEEIDPPPKAGWVYSTAKKDSEKAFFGFSLFSIGSAGGIFVGTLISTIICVSIIYLITFIIKRQRSAIIQKNTEETVSLKAYENL